MKETQERMDFFQRTIRKAFKTYPNLNQKQYWNNHFWSKDYSVSTVS